MTEQPTDHRQAERLAALRPPAVTGQALFDACLELVSGLLAHRAGQSTDHVLEAVLEDLQRADSMDVATTFANLVVSGLEALELVTGMPPADLWRHRVAVAAERNEGGRRA